MPPSYSTQIADSGTGICISDDAHFLSDIRHVAHWQCVHRYDVLRHHNLYSN